MQGTKEPIVIGIDPGSRFVGYGLLQKREGDWRALAYGVLKLPSGKALSHRLVALSRELSSIYDQYQPQLTVIEKVFLGKSVESAFTLGHARGVILAKAAEHGGEIKEYAARSIKKGITGHGGAQKQQVEMMIRSSLGVTDFERDDVSDALALALYGARRWDLNQKMSIYNQGVEL